MVQIICINKLYINLTKGIRFMKQIKCRHFGLDCDFEANAETEDELLQMVGKHAVEVHKMEVTDELVEQAKTLIKEV